jgi:hypothetical protein
MATTAGGELGFQPSSSRFWHGAHLYIGVFGRRSRARAGLHLQIKFVATSVRIRPIPLKIIERGKLPSVLRSRLQVEDEFGSVGLATWSVRSPGRGTGRGGARRRRRGTGAV